MKHFKYILAALSILSLSACSQTAVNPNAPAVLEQHKNIQAEPATTHNLARLIRQKDNCVIEFTGNFRSGQATEYWIFQADQLISAFSQINAAAENTQTVFDVNDPEKLANFKMLQKNFKAAQLAKCH